MISKYFEVQLTQYHDNIHTTVSQWSGVVPACDLVTCPDLKQLLSSGQPRVQVEARSYEAGGVVIFSCPVNYQLVGPR